MIIGPASGPSRSAATRLRLAALPPGLVAEESVDEVTHSALALDAHAAEGRLEFREYCAKCHGPRGLLDATTVVPAIAGQRFDYLADLPPRDRHGPLPRLPRPT